MSGVPQNLKSNEKYKHMLIFLLLLLQINFFTHLFSLIKAKMKYSGIVQNEDKFH